MILTYRPIKAWPEGWPRESPKWTPFKSTFRDTLQLLDRELDAIGATAVTLQVDTSERNIRTDGQLRGDAKITNQGVILTIETRAHGTLVYQCDEFERVGGRGESWRENLRAIALGLEALRKVERYGIANRGQQYAGYRELPSGIAMGAAVMTVEQAAAFIAEHAIESPISGRPAFTAEEILSNPMRTKAAFAIAAKRLHPDAGGDPALFRKLTEARSVIEGNT